MLKARAFTIIVLLLAGALVAGRAGAESTGRIVNGHVEDMVTTDNCGSPVGLCTVGRVNGGIQGQLSFTVIGLSPTSRQGILFFTAESTIRTLDGDIYCADSGSFNSVPGSEGEGVHLCEITGGTGEYAGVAGYLQEMLHFQGLVGTGDYRGRIVFP